MELRTFYWYTRLINNVISKIRVIHVKKALTCLLRMCIWDVMYQCIPHE